jgi:prevent-host-death family protein
MRTINIHQAKTHLSRLVDEAANGESFIIAKAGKPLVKVVKLDAPAGNQMRRLGFMKELSVPDDFDRMGAAEIAARFGGRRRASGKRGPA